MDGLYCHSQSPKGELLASRESGSIYTAIELIGCQILLMVAYGVYAPGESKGAAYPFQLVRIKYLNNDNNINNFE